jgi:hypothetical protein
VAIGGSVAAMAVIYAAAAKALNRRMVDAVLKIQALIRHLDRALLYRWAQFTGGHCDRCCGGDGGWRRLLVRRTGQ